ncbi:DNA damage-inducible protein DinB [Geothrix oryzae]|uniref:DNA damage-inducible protein DinB n=1 Tax=Geothrix oryzae TaxID=2927975 RepID=A0ABN6UWE6_9BACT|nr:DinB family protein [Geothrix oryzae]BDU69076.1 DNA damage-inducible protein DinB [Geothrix oryzae]
MIGLLKDLLGHQAWADAMFFHAWGKSQVREDSELRTRVGHLVDVQEAFLKVLKGEVVSMEEHPLPAFGDLQLRCRTNHEVFRALGRSLDDASLARIVRVPWFPDPPCLVSVTDALVQVCLHTQHHRGQNMTCLKALGAAPKNVDYIIWLWKQKPEARWDS